MRKTFKIVLVLGLAGAFTVGSVLCCCVRNIAHAGAAAKKTHTCCAAKGDAANQPQKKADCDHCSLKPMQMAQSFELIPSFTVAFELLPADIAFVSYHPVVYQTVWANGPPGPISEVPLYIQSHQLRV